MNAEQVNALGGWCELVGVLFLVRDLMSVARYREKPKEWAARFKTGWVRAVAKVRRLMGLPARPVQAHAGAALGQGMALDASAVVIPEPYEPRPELTVEDQIAELGRLLNKLGDAIGQEQHERHLAIAAEREAGHEEVRAEVEERRDVDKLRDVTTGDLGLRIESVLYLAAGIVMTTWPELVADWLPDWLQFRVALAVVLGWPALRFWWQWKVRQGAVAE
jgi:hypothetical protein